MHSYINAFIKIIPKEGIKQCRHLRTFNSGIVLSRQQGKLNPNTDVWMPGVFTISRSF
jgi:hypothetical protein